MTATPHSPFHKEVSTLALFISLPQLLASPVMVAIGHVLQPNNIVFELKEILDFLVISFPLTLSIAILFVILERGSFNLGYLLLVVAGAALLSNLLHRIIDEIPGVDVNKAFNDSFSKTDTGGNATILRFVGKIFGIYWKTFGPILFIQSCCIGLYAGYRYVKLQDKKAKKNKEVADKNSRH